MATTAEQIKVLVTLTKEQHRVIAAAADRKTIPRAIFIRSLLAEWVEKQSQARALTGAERKALTA